MYYSIHFPARSALCSDGGTPSNQNWTRKHTHSHTLESLIGHIIHVFDSLSVIIKSKLPEKVLENVFKKRVATIGSAIGDG